MRKLILTILLSLLFIVLSFGLDTTNYLRLHNTKYTSIQPVWTIPFDSKETFKLAVEFQNPEVIITDKRNEYGFENLIKNNSDLNQRLIEYLDLISKLQTTNIDNNHKVEERRYKESFVGSLTLLSKQTKINEIDLKKIINRKLLSNKIKIILYVIYSFTLIYLIDKSIDKIKYKPITDINKINIMFKLDIIRSFLSIILFYLTINFIDKLVNSEYYYIKELINMIE